MSSRRHSADRQLVEAWLAGAPDAARRLVARLLPQVRKVLFRVLGPDAEYEDWVQETMFQAFKSLPRYRAEASLETWVTHVAVNTAHQAFRKRRGREVSGAGATWEVDAREPPASPEGRAERRELLRALYRLLDRLDEDKRLALALHELQGLPVSRVAELTGVPLSTAKSRIWFGRKELLRMARRDPVLGPLLEAARREGEGDG